MYYMNWLFYCILQNQCNRGMILTCNYGGCCLEEKLAEERTQMRMTKSLWTTRNLCSAPYRVGTLVRELHGCRLLGGKRFSATRAEIVLSLSQVLLHRYEEWPVLWKWCQYIVISLPVTHDRPLQCLEKLAVFEVTAKRKMSVNAHLLCIKCGITGKAIYTKASAILYFKIRCKNLNHEYIAHRQHRAKRKPMGKEDLEVHDPISTQPHLRSGDKVTNATHLWLLMNKEILLILFFHTIGMRAAYL